MVMDVVGLVLVWFSGFSIGLWVGIKKGWFRGYMKGFSEGGEFERQFPNNVGKAVNIRARE